MVKNCAVDEFRAVATWSNFTAHQFTMATGMGLDDFRLETAIDMI